MPEPDVTFPQEGEELVVRRAQPPESSPVVQWLVLEPKKKKRLQIQSVCSCETFAARVAAGLDFMF